jgi:hypothetical protein
MGGLVIGKLFPCLWGMSALTSGEQIPQDARMTLLERTEILLSQRLERAKDKTKIEALRQLADASNGEVQYEWLRKFERGAIENPGVVTIQKLHDYLLKIPADHAA